MNIINKKGSALGGDWDLKILKRDKAKLLKILTPKPKITLRKKLRIVKNEFYSKFIKDKFLSSCAKWDHEKIIKKLVLYTTVKINSINNYHRRRAKNHNIIIDSNCVGCGRAADVMHHVIMIVNGGPNVNANCVPLCNSCHAEVHPWL